MAEMNMSRDVTISDDDFTEEELALIYGRVGPIPGTDSYEEQVEHELEISGAFS